MITVVTHALHPIFNYLRFYTWTIRFFTIIPSVRMLSVLRIDTCFDFGRKRKSLQCVGRSISTKFESSHAIRFSVRFEIIRIHSLVRLVTFTDHMHTYIEFVRSQLNAEFLFVRKFSRQNSFVRLGSAEFLLKNSTENAFFFSFSITRARCRCRLRCNRARLRTCE